MNKLFFLISLIFVVFACNNKKPKTSVTEEAIFIASKQYIIDYLDKQNYNDEYLYFDLKLIDDEIKIYEFSSCLKCNIDTLIYSSKYNVLMFDVFVNDLSANKVKKIAKERNWEEFALHDPTIELLIINVATGEFKAVNFGQNYKTFYEMVCESVDIINTLRND